MEISCTASEWQLSSLEHVCTSSFPAVSMLETLYIFEDQGHPLLWQNDVENTLWLELLHPFAAEIYAPYCACSARTCRRGDSDSFLTWVGAWIFSGTVLSGGSSAPFGFERSKRDSCSVSTPGLGSLVAASQFLLLVILSGLSVLRRLDGCFDWSNEKVRAFVPSSVAGN